MMLSVTVCLLTVDYFIAYVNTLGLVTIASTSLLCILYYDILLYRAWEVRRVDILLLFLVQRNSDKISDMIGCKQHIAHI